jgi:hypothetical protein
MQTVPSKSAPLVTENKLFGFFGTCQFNYGLSDSDLAILFDRAGQQLLLSGKFGDRVAVMEFLDGRLGRHFSHGLSFHVGGPAATLDQLTSAISAELEVNGKQWLKWFRRISR